MKRPTINSVLSQVPADYFEEKNLNFFQKIAHHWKLKVVLGLLKDLDFKRGLDVGCASGNLTEKIRKVAQKEKFWGIDLYQGAIKLGQKKYPKLHLQVAAADNLPFPSRSFELIVILDTFEHLNQPQRFLKEAKRVLKKKGHLILGLALEGRWLFKAIWFFWLKGKGKIWRGAHLQSFSRPWQIIALLRKAGFKVEKKRLSHFGLYLTIKTIKP